MDFSAIERCPVCESRLLERLLAIQSDTESWFECEVCQHVIHEPLFEHAPRDDGAFWTPTVSEADDRAFLTALRARFAASR